MEQQFILELHRIHKEYLEKAFEITHYYLYNFITNAIVVTQDEIELKKLINNIGVKEVNYENFKKSRKQVEGKYNSINVNLIYKSHFQSFEEFLSDVLYCCFSFFPKFMNKIDSRNDIPFDKIYNESSSLEDIKDFMITYRVKTIIQSNNILDILTKIEKTLSCNFNLDDEVLNMLYINSLNRNLLTHNNGVINEVYLNKLKLKNISTEKLNKKSKLEIPTKIHFSHAGNQTEIADRINDCISKDVKRLVAYHTSL